jgi:putative tricarboxylic transport membrane protein
MKLVPALMCTIALLSVGSPGLHSAEYPAKSIEMVAAGGAGGGLDLVARTLDSVLREEKLLKDPFVIRNMGGAGGNLAKTYVHQKKGDGHVLYVESNRIYLNRIVGTTQLTYTDVTPIGRIMTEYLVWVVRADSPHKSAKEILDKLKSNPASVVFGVGTVPGNDQMNILRPARAVGVDAKKVQIVTFKAGGDLMIQLLGGHVAVISTGLSEALEQVKGGKARIVAVSSPTPVAGDLAKVPNWRSMGIDVAIMHWRGLFAPPGIPAEVVRYWDQSRAKMVKTDAWKKAVERHQWFDAYADSATFRRELEQETKVYTEILTELGMAKDPEKK